MLTEHDKFAQGLYELACWYKEHPEIPLPNTKLSVYSLDTKEDALKLAKAMGSFNKEYNSYYFEMTKTFGPIALTFTFNRSNICTKKVVGVETVPAQYHEAYTTPARTNEIVEWECHPLLNNNGD